MVPSLLRTATLTGRGAKARIRTEPLPAILERLLGKDKSGATRLEETTIPWLRQPDPGRTLDAFAKCAVNLLRDPIPEETIRALRIPILSVWGEMDPLCPPARAERFVALRPGDSRAQDRCGRDRCERDRHERW